MKGKKPNKKRNMERGGERRRGELGGEGGGSTLSTGSLPFSSEWTAFINSIIFTFDSQDLLQSNI